jgi:hypothetical protein
MKQCSTRDLATALYHAGYRYLGEVRFDAERLFVVSRRPSDERSPSEGGPSGPRRSDGRTGPSKTQAKVTAKRVKGGPSNEPDITSFDAEISKQGGTKKTHGLSASDATTSATTTGTRDFFLATRTCFHCGVKGLVLRGRFGECYACRKFTPISHA